MESPVEPGDTTTTESGWPVWVEQWVLPYLKETALWPVLAALIGHVVVIIAPLLSAVARGNRYALLPLFFVVLITGQIAWLDIRRAKGPGGVTVVLALLWVISAIVAYAAFVTDVF